jgi:hypothetical protein
VLETSNEPAPHCKFVSEPGQLLFGCSELQCKLGLPIVKRNINPQYPAVEAASDESHAGLSALQGARRMDESRQDL